MHFGAGRLPVRDRGRRRLRRDDQATGRPGQPRPGPGRHLRQDAAHRPARQSRSKATDTRVPKSNPFVKVKGAQPEIWAYGLRNPWRWSFDRLTHDLWIGDVGMWSYEEVNRAKAPNAGKGDNFGWRRMEGPACYNPARHCDNGKLTPPFAWYAHKDGMCAVAGGYVYRGKRYPALRSWYVFGDYCSGKVDAPELGGQVRPRSPRSPWTRSRNISAFGEGRGRRAVHGRLRPRQHRSIGSPARPSEPGPSTRGRTLDARAG